MKYGFESDPTIWCYRCEDCEYIDKDPEANWFNMKGDYECPKCGSLNCGVYRNEPEADMDELLMVEQLFYEKQD